MNQLQVSDTSLSQRFIENSSIGDEGSIGDDNSLQDTQQVTIATNHLDLYECIVSDAINWQIHNCKLVTSVCDKEGKLPFIYYYDRLDEHVKKEKPLTPQLLMLFNKKMTAQQACTILELPVDAIESPWFVKLKGSVVIYNELMQLAIKLNWSNSIQESAPLYCQSKEQAIAIAGDNWQFVGAVHVLNKHAHNAIIVDSLLADESVINKNIDGVNNKERMSHQAVHNTHILTKSNEYQQISNAQALSLLVKLNEVKDTLFMGTTHANNNDTNDNYAKNNYNQKTHSNCTKSNCIALINHAIQSRVGL